MKVLLTTDVRVFACGDRYYLYRMAFGAIVERYVKHFGKLTLLARVQKIDQPDDSMADYTDMIDELVQVGALKDLFMPRTKRLIRRAVEKVDFVIVRAPSVSAGAVVREARRQGKKYLAEAMGCAWDSFFNHSLLGRVIAPVMFLDMRSIFRHADYALYVTSEFLQKRYPCRCESIGASNVKLPEVTGESLERRLARQYTPEKVSLMTTAAVNVRFKGQQYVIEAMKLLRERGVQAEYYLAGAGDQSWLREIACKHGVQEQVHFLGQLNRQKLFDQLDEVDVYVQPSLQEGLPRAVIEAMSRGCPALGARTAGIPELLAPRCVFRRRSAKAIADAVMDVLSKETLDALAAQNHERSKEYLEETIDARRSSFFRKIREEMERTAE